MFNIFCLFIEGLCVRVGKKPCLLYDGGIFGDRSKLYILINSNAFQVDKMKNTLVIAVAVIVAIIIVAVSSVLYLSQQVPVQYDGTLTVAAGSGYPGNLALRFHASNILYNCKAVITYQATNGSQVQITENLGTVDANSQPASHRIWLTDYPIDKSEVISVTQDTVVDNLKIKAYGYLTPYIG